MAQPLKTGSDWLKSNPPAEERLSQTLAVVARRAKGGEDFAHAVREFLDEFALRANDHSRSAAIEERPKLTGDRRQDAYLGALAEHLAALHRLERPAWSLEPERFLASFWFISDVPGFRAIAIAQTPAAFRRRRRLCPRALPAPGLSHGPRRDPRRPHGPGRGARGAGRERRDVCVGGAAIALAFDERRSTRDIDAVFEPKSTVYEAAALIAERLGLPPGWLNDAVKGFLAGEDPAAAPILDLPGLRCLAASPEILLALKVLAHRVGDDEEDLRLLAAQLGLSSADEVLAIAERTYGDRLDAAARFFVEEVFSTG
jgi:hypothetical protein